MDEAGSEGVDKAVLPRTPTRTSQEVELWRSLEKNQSGLAFAIPTKSVVYLTQTILVVVFDCCPFGNPWEFGK